MLPVEAAMSPRVGHRGWLARLAEWWRNVRKARGALDEIDPSGEGFEFLAHDLGLSAAELQTMAAKRPDSAVQLKARDQIADLPAPKCPN